jgi:hypothetical protein
MRNRLTKLLAGVAAVASLAIGGSAIASAGSTPQPASPPAVQQTVDPSTPSDNDNGSATESSSETVDASDGPSGHADAPGSVDHQAEGSE